MLGPAERRELRFGRRVARALCKAQIIQEAGD